MRRIILLAFLTLTGCWSVPKGYVLVPKSDISELCEHNIQFGKLLHEQVSPLPRYTLPDSTRLALSWTSVKYALDALELLSWEQANWNLVWFWQ